MKIRPDLSGVPETALWTLWFRAGAAGHPDEALEDPMAVGLIERIDYPFAERFGSSRLAPLQAARVRTFDAQVRGFLRNHPHGTVVALGEGFETQFWRVDNGSVNWLTVDLPESVAVREALLPPGDRQRIFAGSALDPAWVDLVDPSGGVMITAQGLLPYFRPEQVQALISMCAKAFPGGTMVFDALPPWTAGAVRRGTIFTFKPPPLQWTLEPSRLGDLKAFDPAIERVVDVHLFSGRGLAGWLLPRLRHLPVLRHKRPVIVALHFRA